MKRDIQNIAPRTYAQAVPVLLSDEHPILREQSGLKAEARSAIAIDKELQHERPS